MAGVSKFSGVELTGADWAWKAMDLGIWRTTPVGATIGAGVGAGTAINSQVKGNVEDADISGAALTGAAIGAGIGAAFGVPGVIDMGFNMVKLSRGATAGFAGNTLGV